jgi:predicted RNase H-like nuclease
MVAVLGIDAAWTARKDSGYALIAKEDTHWRLIAAAASLPTFAECCGCSNLTPLHTELSINSAERALGGALPDVVAIDMPLSEDLIVGRRASDQAISRRFGKAGCSTHSPSMVRPGELGRELQRRVEGHGYRLVTSLRASEPFSLVEVYPHPALLRLMGVAWRVETAPSIENAATLSDLKPVEDLIDAVISAWVGSTFIEGRAEAFGDEVSAIWVPCE